MLTAGARARPSFRQKRRCWTKNTSKWMELSPAVSAEKLRKIAMRYDENLRTQYASMSWLEDNTAIPETIPASWCHIETRLVQKITPSSDQTNWSFPTARGTVSWTSCKQRRGEQKTCNDVPETYQFFAGYVGRYPRETQEVHALRKINIGPRTKNRPWWATICQNYPGKLLIYIAFTPNRRGVCDDC